MRSYALGKLVSFRGMSMSDRRKSIEVKPKIIEI